MGMSIVVVILVVVVVFHYLGKETEASIRMWFLFSFSLSLIVQNAWLDRLFPLVFLRMLPYFYFFSVGGDEGDDFLHSPHQ